MANSRPVFEYEALSEPSRQMRLLNYYGIVQDNHGKTRIHYQLHTFDFQTSVPSYTALSYTWGSSAEASEIVLNGCIFTVRQNLYEFLFRFAQCSPASTTYLWVDQLCIDQSHVEERSAQVVFMSHIYATADRTIIWLGNSLLEPFFLDHGIRNNHLDHIKAGYWERRLGALQIPEDEYIRGLWLSDRKERLQNDTTVQVWHWLYQRPYWTRLWIIQEICLSRVIHIWFGRATMSWRVFNFGNACLSRPRHPVIRKSVSDPFAAVLSISRIPRYAFVLCEQSSSSYGPERYLRGTHEVDYDAVDLVLAADPEFNIRTIGLFREDGLSLSEVVRRTTAQRCADPHDVIYALLSLVRQTRKISADYSLTTEQLFEKVLRHVIDEFPGNTKDYLKFCGLLLSRLGLEDGAWLIDCAATRRRRSSSKIND